MTDRITTIVIISRILIGLFWLDHGIGKLESGWLTGDKLATRLTGNSLKAPSYVKPYIKHVLQPAAPVVQRMVLFGELAVGLAFVVGFWTKPAVWGAIFMIFNFKFVGGRLFTWATFGDAYIFPLIVAMVLITYLSTRGKGSIMTFIPFLKRYEFPKL